MEKTWYKFEWAGSHNDTTPSIYIYTWSSCYWLNWTFEGDIRWVHGTPRMICIYKRNKLWAGSLCQHRNQIRIKMFDIRDGHVQFTNYYSAAPTTIYFITIEIFLLHIRKFAQTYSYSGPWIQTRKGTNDQTEIAQTQGDSHIYYHSLLICSVVYNNTITQLFFFRTHTRSGITNRVYIFQLTTNLGFSDAKICATHDHTYARYTRSCVSIHKLRSTHTHIVCAFIRKKVLALCAFTALSHEFRLFKTNQFIRFSVSRFFHLARSTSSNFKLIFFQKI